ncbi:MAG: segregation/condensation protein A [Oscillospiraceae bacterium]|nr:segregation/condensation protein A [Oscillospiraceae bacterium]
MPTLEFKLEVFTGPLDLLLHLISKHKLNINDIEISKLLEQYLLYIEEAQRQDLELAGEFLEMAARLVWIKTVSLLPKPEEAERAKQELQGSLIEFALAQQAAEALRQRFIADDIFVRAPMKLPKERQLYQLTHSSDRLAEVFAQIGKARMDGQRLTEKIQDTVTQEKVVSVTSKIVHVLREVYGGRTVTVASLYEGLPDWSSHVATFLEVLELTRFGPIRLKDDNTLLTICEQKGGR